jgi:hypothetical protein
MAARTEEEGSAYSSRGRGRAAPWRSRDGGDEWVVERRGEERRVQRRGIFRAFEGLFRFVGSSENPRPRRLSTPEGSPLACFRRATSGALARAQTVIPYAIHMPYANGLMAPFYWASCSVRRRLEKPKYGGQGANNSNSLERRAGPVSRVVVL